MIVELRAENFQRLKAVQIRPNSRIVQLTGGNDQGKTSILQAIAAAIKGKPACPTDPIRDDCEKAWISLDLGDKVVRRTFTRGKDGEPFTTSLIVEAKVEGGKAKLGSPADRFQDIPAPPAAPNGDMEEPRLETAPRGTDEGDPPDARTEAPEIRLDGGDAPGDQPPEEAPAAC
jgi:hypothetical protein